VLKQIEAELVLDLHGVQKKSTPTLQEAFDAAMRSHYAAKKSKQTMVYNYNTVAGIIGKNIRLGEVTEDTYDDIVEAMYEDGAAPGTVNRKLALLSRLLRLNERKIPHKLPRVPLQDEYAGRKRYLSDAEETALFEAVGSRIEKHGGEGGWTTFNALVTFLIETGVRRGEALRVEPGHIAQDRNLEVWESKGNLSRTIPLTERGYEAVMSAGGSFGLSKDQVNHFWKVIRSDLGKLEEEGFVIHCLRHTCCTRLIKSGVNLHMVQKWMGHKRIETTLIYAHLDTEDLHACRDSLQRRVPKLYQIPTSGEEGGSTLG
jgi:integrase